MKTKIAAIAVLALMMVAATPIVGAKFEEARERYAEAKKEFQDAYSEWKRAREDFIQARERWRGDRNETNFSNLLNASREAAVKAADLMVRSLEILKARVEATRGLSENEMAQLTAEIDGYIGELQAKRANIQDAADEQQLRTAARDLWSYWTQIRVRLKQITAELIVGFAKAAVQRVEAFAARVEAKIQQLKDNGVDTTNLGSWLADLRSRIDVAGQRIADAESRIDQITDNVTFREIFRVAVERVKEAINYLKEALKRLKDIISEMRNKGQPVIITGSGTMSASGNGRVLINGTGTVEVLAEIQGNLMVSENATVTTSGEGTTTDLGNGFVLYQGYDNAKIVGTDFTIEIDGDGIDIFASGSGAVRLSGSGTYSTQGENYYVKGTWTAAEVSVQLETGQAS